MFFILRNKSLGMGLIGWSVAILITFILLSIITIGFYEGRKAYWDHKVTQLCMEDGGAIVFENVKISQDDYKKLGGVNGVIPVPSERFKKDSPYFARTVTQKIREQDPEVIKWSTEIIRNTDEKILGKQISYLRIGGDIPTGIAHPSSYSCKYVEGVALDIEKRIFIINGDEK